MLEELFRAPIKKTYVFRSSLKKYKRIILNSA
jgi:hypothetical protein